MKAMFDLSSLFSPHELLEMTASYLRTIDLFNTALTCSDLYCLIIKPDEIRRRLKQKALCDGSGLERFKISKEYTRPRGGVVPIPSTTLTNWFQI